jgi:hypothetical protein
MLDSHGLVLFFLWLLAAAGIFMFARWLNHFLDRFTLESDTRLLIMIAFIGIVLFGTLNFLWGKGSRQTSGNTSPTSNTNRQEIVNIEATDANTFVKEHYPSLHDHRYNLKRRIAELKQFFQDVQRWAGESPHQVTFLQNVVEIQWKSLEELKKTDDAVDLSIREFWIHYSTGETHFVAQVFEEKSAQLIEQIRDAQAFDNTGFNAEQKEIQTLLDKALQQLAYTDIPPDPKNRKKPQAFAPYDKENRQRLMEWLQLQKETTLLANLNVLQDNQTQIDKKLREIQVYLKQAENRALYTPMQKVIKLWQDLSLYNQYADYQLLFAVEAEYLRQKLAGYQAKEKAQDERTLNLASRLHGELLQVAPEIARRAQSRRVDEVERSYSPSTFLLPDNKK